MKVAVAVFMILSLGVLAQAKPRVDWDANFGMDQGKTLGKEIKDTANTVGRLATAAIIGIIVAVLIVICCVISLCCYCIKRTTEPSTIVVHSSQPQPR